VLTTQGDINEALNTYKFNASVDQKYRPNDLLAWDAILYGHRRALTTLDFGISENDQPGLVRRDHAGRG
jgi:hypothetical protein